MSIGNAFSKVDLNLKALLALRNGILRPASLAHNRSKGIGRLREFIRSELHIEELAIVYSINPDDAHKLAADTVNLLPNLVPKIVKLGSTLSIHARPEDNIAVVR